MGFLGVALIIIFSLVICFQIALAFGAPLGEYTMGGKYSGKLPKHLRVATLVQIVILFLFILIVGIKTNIFFQQYPKFGNVGIWFVLSFFILSAVLNTITPSKKERMIWGPISILTLILIVIVVII